MPNTISNWVAAISAATRQLAWTLTHKISLTDFIRTWAAEWQDLNWSPITYHAKKSWYLLEHVSLGEHWALDASVRHDAIDNKLAIATTIEQADPACGFPVVRAATNAKVEYALTNSFGFGGANASVILRRCA